MRLFIAADLDSGARDAVSDAVARLRARSEHDLPGSTRGVAWVAAPNLHLTLHFLGEVGAAGLPALTTALAPVIDAEPPRIGLAGWGVFPQSAPARVIWLGVVEGAEALASAHADIGRRLRAAGLVPESRPFSAHLTVGRVKRPSGLHWHRVLSALQPEPAVSWRVDACTLYESHLSSAGPSYRALMRMHFGGSARELSPPPVGSPPPEDRCAK